MVKFYARDRKLSQEEMEQFKRQPNENKRFKFLYGPERLEKFKQYRNQLPEDLRDMNVWIKPFTKGGNEFMSPREFDEEINAIIEANERRAEQRALEVQETDEEREERLRKEEQARLEGQNITPIVESDGLEYLGADGKYRVYKATSYEGAHKFALPRSEGRGWCITGSGSWGDGPGEGPYFWRNQLQRTSDNAFYFFMTTPARDSYCVFKVKAEKGRLKYVDNATDSETYIRPEAAKLPLNIAGLEEGSTISSIKKIEGPFYVRGTKLTGLTQEGLNMDFIMIRADISTIGTRAICGTRNLKELKLTSNTRIIEPYGISANISLKEVKFDGSEASFGEGALEYNGDLLYFNFPNKSNVAPKMLRGCHKLQRVSLPEGVTTIGESAFEGCSSLIFVDIPSTCTTIKENAFNGCRSLTIKAHFAEKPAGWYNNIEKHVNRIVWLEEPVEETPVEEIQAEEVVAEDSVDDTDDVRVLDVKPKKGEKKKEFLQRFMKETEKEYPNEKQRYAVANSYWEKKKIKDAESIVEIKDEEVEKEEVVEDNTKKEVVTFTIQTFKKEALDDLKASKNKNDLDERYDKWLEKSEDLVETGKITIDQQEAFEDELWEIYKNIDLK